MLRNLQPKIGFAWTARAIAFLNLAVLGTALCIFGRHKQVIPHRKRTFRTIFDFRALREPAFAWFTISLFFLYCGLYIPLFYIPLFA